MVQKRDSAKIKVFVMLLNATKIDASSEKLAKSVLLTL